MEKLAGLFDNALAWWCRDEELNGVCIDAHPGYFYQHRARGKAGKNSDNVDDQPEREQGESANLQWSTRLNLEGLLMGRREFEDAYPYD